MLVFGLVGVVLQYRAERTDAARGALELARDLGSVLEADLKARSAALQTLALSPSLAAGDLSAFRSQLQQMISVQFPASSIRLWDANGQQVLNTALPWDATLPVPEPPPNLQQIFANGQTGISNVYTDAGSTTPVVAIEVPVLREDGGVSYALSMNPPLTMVTEQFSSMPIRDGWTVAVADRSGTILARSKDGNNYVGKKAGAAFFAHVARIGSFVTEVVNRQGTDVLMTFRQSEPSGWTVVVGIPRADLTSPAWHLAFLTLTAGVVLLVLGLMMAQIVATRITRPIHALRLLSTAEDRGAYATAPFATGLREVDEVGEALLKSFAELRDNRVELARVNAGLEFAHQRSPCRERSCP